ncbi:MAG: DUF3750 domain-containing protein [Candidatus Rokubacteria bacterium]|nr:DUF3750 domain-containing protein [Candidatus Rokubacteria bacterium]
MRARRASRAVGLVFLGIVLPIVASCATLHRDGDWWAARRDPSGQAPDPSRTSGAVVQVYAARTVGWRSALAVHTWIALKRAGAHAYTRYEVIGWGVDRGSPAVRVNRAGPDNYWFGARPDLLVDLRGADVDAIIDRVEAAIARYPYPSTYRTWPGPNSNTFTAWIAREVPELRLDLPPTAIGKDYLADGAFLARTPGGIGLQLSLLGLAGVLAGWEEGFELQLLGLTFGLDLKEPALKLPGIGRLGHSGAR